VTDIGFAPKIGHQRRLIARSRAYSWHPTLPKRK